MVRVLRHNGPPEESSSTAEELEAEYGCGKYLPEQNVYLCALPARLRRALEEINSAPKPPPFSPASTSVRLWLIDWSRKIAYEEETGAEAMETLNNAIVEVLGVMLGSDKAWAECVRAAAAADPGRPLLLVTPPSRPRVQLKVEESVGSALSLGWNLKYDDPLGVLKYLGRVVDGYMKVWAQGNHHAAWTMALQSSGWGKSRSIQELATKGFHVAYVSFMSPDETGIPGRSAVAKVLTSIESDTSDPRCIAAWVVAILLQIKDASPEKWRETQASFPKEGQGQEKWSEAQESFREEVSQSYNELKEDVTETVPHQAPAPGDKWHPDQLRLWIDNKLSGVFTPGRKVVFCLDEAASLFKAQPGSFLAFRRFFSAVPHHSKLFGLVADTAGKLGLIFPHKMFDPSARGLDPAAKFFQPVWMVGSACRQPDKLKRLMSEQKDLAAVSEDYTRELFKTGRPLWRALLANKASLAGAVQFASQKLLNGVSLVRLQKSMITEAMATAIIGVVAGLEVAAWADLAQHMVAGHMRSVNHVSGDRERVFTADVIEPILGEAAGHIFADVEVLLLLLQTMGGVLKQAFVVEGPRGEIVGRLLLVLAMHHCCELKQSAGRHEMYSHPVPLGSFLSVLCSRTVTVEGFIFFNRFMFLNRKEISRELLLFCFLCGFAIIPQRNQAGFDVLLPWLVPGPDGKYQLHPDRMRAVPVQIRNRQADAVKAQKLAAWLSSWTPKDKENEQASKPDKASSSRLDGSDNDKLASTCRHDGRPPKRAAAVAARSGLRKYFQSEKDEELREKAEEFREKAEERERDLVAGRPVKKQRRAEDKINLGDECGLYLHVKVQPGVEHQVDITQDSKVLVLRGVRFSFLEERVSAELEKMCDAFFKVEDELEGDEKRGKIVRHNFSNYFKLRKAGNSKVLEPDLLVG